MKRTSRVGSLLPTDYTAFVKESVAKSPVLMRVLRCMRDNSPMLWLGGGALRNLVWDRLTGRTTIQEDFDIVYFDASDLSPVSDTEIETELSLKLSSDLNISVKNQARMHLKNSEPAVQSLREAIANWPETATAVVVRLNSVDDLEIISPHSLDDLINMRIRPTPYHAKNRTSFNNRLLVKQWSRHWPEISIVTQAE